MGVREFVKTRRKTIVGTSLTVTGPTGEYNGTKLINLGTNRWGFKPEVGVAVPKGPWDFDAYFGVWLFTDNDNFYPGGRIRSQERVVGLRATRVTHSGRASGPPSMQRGIKGAVRPSAAESCLGR